MHHKRHPQSPLKNLKLSAAGIALWAALTIPMEAALLIDEGFNYGGSDVALNAVNGSATGLAGTTYSGSGAYDSTGLTFGSLVTSGGSASLTAPASNQFARRQLNTGTITGTVYGSFLFQQPSSLSPTDFLAVGYGPSNATDNTATVSFLPDKYSTSGSDVGAVRSDPFNDGSPAYSINGSAELPSLPTPVMLGLYEITNVGAVSGTQSVTFWMLNEAQFENFRFDGLTTSELNSASIGSGASNVFDRLSLSIDGTGGYIDLNNTDYLGLMYRSGTYLVDEIRLSNLSLNEVTPVPEPSGAALIAFAGLAILTCRSRRKRK